MMRDLTKTEIGTVIAVDTIKVPFLYFFKKEIIKSCIVRTDDGKIQVVGVV